MFAWRFCRAVTWRRRSGPLPKTPLPDSAYVAGTKFSRALIEDHCELHLVASLELQTVLYFFHVEEQFLAFADFVCDKAKLRRRKATISTPQRHFAQGEERGARGRASEQSAPDLWRTRPRLCVEAPPYTPSSAQCEVPCTPGTSQVLLSEDSRPCWPYSWFQRVFSGLYFHLKRNPNVETVDLQPSAVEIHLLIRWKHPPSSMTSISPWYSVWEGSTLRRGRMTFPVITVASISSPRAFTAGGKELSSYVHHLKYTSKIDPMNVFLPGATLVTFSALILFPFPLEGKYSTVSPSSRLSKSPNTSLRRYQIPLT